MQIWPKPNLYIYSFYSWFNYWVLCLSWNRIDENSQGGARGSAGNVFLINPLGWLCVTDFTLACPQGNGRLCSGLLRSYQIPNIPVKFWKQNNIPNYRRILEHCSIEGGHMWENVL